MSNLISIAVEDELTEVVVRRLVSELLTGWKVGVCYPERSYSGHDTAGGWGYLWINRDAFKSLAISNPFMMVVDLDDNGCAPSMIRNWFPNGMPPKFVFRVCVREVESWLLADDGLANYLQAQTPRLPSDSDAVTDPKIAIVDLARSSYSSTVRDDMVPRSRTSSAVGPYFNKNLKMFAQGVWDVDIACLKSESLRRTCSAIRQIPNL